MPSVPRDFPFYCFRIALSVCNFNWTSGVATSGIATESDGGGRFNNSLECSFYLFNWYPCLVFLFPDTSLGFEAEVLFLRPSPVRRSLRTV